MKVSMLSLLSSAVSTATTMMVVGVFIGNTNTPLVVSAQLYISCSDEVLDDGTPYELCRVNTPSPFTLELLNGNSVSFGNESYVFTSCIGGARSNLTCACNMVVNPSDPLAVTDFCDSCTVIEITDTTFLPYFDCSNRLVGDCVGFDSEGFCIDNNNGVGTPAPIGAPTPFPATSTTPAPRSTPSPVTPSTPAPVMPIIPPTPFPVVIMTAAPLAPPTPFPVAIATQAPRVLPTAFPITATTSVPRSPPTTIPPTPAPRAVVPPPTTVSSVSSASSGGSGSSIVGIAIGSAVGGVALATVVAFFLLFSKRKQAESSSNSASKPTNESHYTESNTNDDFTSSSRPPTTPQDYMGYSATAALVQPSPISHQPQPPPLYPAMEVPSNHNNRYANNEVIEPNYKREVFVPPPDMPVPGVRTSVPRQSATSSSSHRSSYPNNHVVDVKDQCRSVAMVRSSSPTLVSPTTVDTTSTTIPFAVALGVSTTTATTQPSVTSSTSSRTSKKEPAGRIFLDM